MKFWDSSAVMPLLVKDRATDFVTSLLERDPLMAVWWGTEVECVSALARLERSGVPIEPLSQSFERLRHLASAWIEVRPSELLRETAKRLLRVHPLRPADSLQLAAAVTVLRSRSSNGDFVCLDARLCAAAHREGLNILSV